MSKNFVWCALASVLVLSGCASSGAVRTDSTIANPVAAPANAPVTSGVEIPKDAKGKPVVRADTKENFEAIEAAIRQQMQPGGRWQYMDNGERSTIDNSFADMDQLYTKFGSVDKMDQPAKMRLLADQSTVNAILTRKDGDRLICQSVAPVGSHLPVRTCRTFAQMQAETRNAQRELLERTRAGTVQNSH